jgi:hypothetical protein
MAMSNMNLEAVLSGKIKNEHIAKKLKKEPSVIANKKFSANALKAMGSTNHILI